MATNGTHDLATAMRNVLKRFPTLYEEYKRECTASVKPSGGPVAPERGNGRGERPSDRVMTLARAAMENDATLDLSKAVKLVFKQEPTLYEQYRRDVIG